MIGYEPEELIGRWMHGVAHHTRQDGNNAAKKKFRRSARSTVPMMGCAATNRTRGVLAKRRFELPGRVLQHSYRGGWGGHYAVATFRDINGAEESEETSRAERYRAFFETAVGASEAVPANGAKPQVNQRRSAGSRLWQGRAVDHDVYRSRIPDDRAGDLMAYPGCCGREIREYVTEKRYIRTERSFGYTPAAT